MYLGDGDIVSWRRGVYWFVIALDAAYPGIIAECAQAVAAVVPGAPPYLQSQKNSRCVWLVKYSKRWPCLFPQYGPGPKHARRLLLSAWQETLVGDNAELFLRGLIHSDGSRFSNPIRHPQKRYTYVRYTFSNSSADIRQLFCDACDRLGIEWRVMNAKKISVARRIRGSARRVRWT